MPKGIYKHKSSWNKGKKHSPEQLKKMVGKNNSRWKGGITLGKNRKSYVDNYNKEYRRNLRKVTVEALGGRCVLCGFTDIRALQIDHINGGGNKERKEKIMLGQGRNFHKIVLESFLGGENKYQLLCANCNWIKRFTNNEVRGNYN